MTPVGMDTCRRQESETVSQRLLKRIWLPLQHKRSQGSQRGHALQISSVSCRFVLWEAVSQTKYCCSLEVRNIWPLPIIWAGYATVSPIGKCAVVLSSFHAGALVREHRHSARWRRLFGVATCHRLSPQHSSFGKLFRKSVSFRKQLTL